MDFIKQYPVVSGIVFLVLAFILIAWAFAKNYVKTPPDEVAVFTGRGVTKYVRGGARFRMPLIEQVNKMSLQTFNIEVGVANVYSKDVVPVNVAAISVVAFGLTEEALATSTSRFLRTERVVIEDMIKEVLAGNMRNIVSQMTVEELNSNRDDFAHRVSEEATASLTPLGLELKVFNIKNLTDDHQYLDALGQTRTAEVKRDAAIGKAKADRDAMIQAATATQEGKQAQAQAAILTAQAERARDLELAGISSEVEAAKAKAAQAGPLARANAEREVVLAGVATQRAETEAQIGVEEQRAKQKQQAVQADIIIPAEAEKTASIARAEGAREASIAAATAAAKQRELQGKADADARTVLAAANKVEKEAEAAGNEALKVAEANGIKALRLAEAEGQEKLAEALSKFDEESSRLSVLPLIIKMMPELARQIAEGVNIEKMVVIDSGSADGKGAISRAINTTPAMLAQVTEIMSSMGLNLGDLIGGLTGNKNAAAPAAKRVEHIDISANGSPQPVI